MANSPEVEDLSRPSYLEEAWPSLLETLFKLEKRAVEALSANGFVEHLSLHFAHW